MSCCWLQPAGRIRTVAHHVRDWATSARERPSETYKEMSKSADVIRMQMADKFSRREGEGLVPQHTAEAVGAEVDAA